MHTKACPKCFEMENNLILIERGKYNWFVCCYKECIDTYKLFQLFLRIKFFLSVIYFVALVSDGMLLLHIKSQLWFVFIIGQKKLSLLTHFNWVAT